MTKVKSNPPKQTKDNQFELIDLDLVKSEPEEVISSPAATTSVAKIQNDSTNQDFVGNPIIIAPHASPRAVAKPVPVALNVPGGPSLQQANYTLTGAGGQPSKTFLLINNRTGVQSMLLSGNAVGRKPFSGVIESSQLPQIRVRTSVGGMQTIVSNTGPKTSSSNSLIAQRQSESGTSNKMLIDGGTISAARPCINAIEFQPRPLSTVCDVIFTSRSIDPDGTVKTIKEYLCNLCQYKVSVQSEFEAHKTTHTFSCNHCKFKALTRFDVLKHKKQNHLNCSEELAGYHDLDKLIDSVNAAQALTSTSPPTTSNIPSQLCLVEPQRPSSSEPPLLELQNVSSSSAVPVEKPQNITANNDTKVPSENFEDESRQSDSVDSSTQNSGKVAGGSTDVQAPETKQTTTRLSRPRRAVAEKKTALRDMDSDTPIDMDNKTDDDDWEEKVPKSSGKKRGRKSLEPNKVMNNVKTPEVPKILPNQQDQAGTLRRLSCMKYKCSSCSFETADTLALSEHIKSHDVSQNNDPTKNQATSPNKIVKDPSQVSSSAIHWSCFYCNLSSASQATIVTHVMKAHPGSAIQLKRISIPLALQQLQSPAENTVAAAASTETSQTSALNQTLSPVQAHNVPPPAHQNLPIKQATITKSRSSNPDNEGCLWGCYYCNIQSIERSEVIAHLKREHQDFKLIVTRRRITHIPANFKATGKDNDADKPAEEKHDSAEAGKSTEPQEEMGGCDSEKTAPSSEKEEENRGRPNKRKLSGGKRKKSLANVNSEPRVLRSRRVSPGSLSPSLREGSPSHVSVNSSEGAGPPSKKKKGRQDDQDKNLSGTSMLTGDMEVANNNETKQPVVEQQQKTIFVRKIQDYPKPLAMKLLMEEMKWKCGFCEFKASSRSKVVYHNMSNHPEKPVKFHRLMKGRSMDWGDSSCSRLRGPRSAREANLLKNGNWLWQCPVCHRKHISKGYLNVHLKVAHPRRAGRAANPAPIRRCKTTQGNETSTTNCSVCLVRAEDMVHYDSLSNILLDNGLSLIKSLDVDDDLECDVVRHRKYKCGKCDVRGFRPMIVKRHFLEAHSATEVLVVDLKNSHKSKNGDGCVLYSCLGADCKFFTTNKSELEAHYNDYPEHARIGPNQTERRRGLNGSDSEITDPSFERTSEARDLAVRDSPGQVNLKIPSDVSQLATEGGPNNSLRTIFLTPKNSDIASGLSMLKKTLSSAQVVKLGKPNGPDDQQQSQALPRS